MKTAKPILAASLALALAACGGGSGEISGTMMPEPLALATGVAIGDQGPLLAQGSGTDDPAFVTREASLADPNNTFRVFSATLHRAGGSASAVETGEHVKSLRGDGDFGFHVTYVDAEGSEITHHFMKDSLRNSAYSYDDLGYWLWAFSSVPFDGANYARGGSSGFAFLGTQYFGGSYRSIAVYGPETPDSFFTENGVTAEYQGSMFAQTWDNNAENFNRYGGDNRYTVRGDVVLNYVFQGDGQGTVTGAVENMTVDGVPLSAGNRIAITDGRYSGAPFSAAMTATGDTMGGYEGGLAGAFYGPTAEAAAAVFAMQREDQGNTVHPHHAMLGNFWAVKPGDTP